MPPSTANTGMMPAKKRATSALQKNACSFIVAKRLMPNTIGSNLTETFLKAALFPRRVVHRPDGNWKVHSSFDQAATSKGGTWSTQLFEPNAFGTRAEAWGSSCHSPS